MMFLPTKILLGLLFMLVSIAGYAKVSGLYQPTWDSLDARPLPRWYDEAKLGIFIHWGVYSVPATVSEWFWWFWQGERPEPDVVKWMKDNYPSTHEYADFAALFTAQDWEPHKWADLFAASGAKYVVLTAKHHEGYSLWPTHTSPKWNSMEVGPGRDLVGELAIAIRNRTKIRFGIYHSLLDWFHPFYVKDKESKFINRTFPQIKPIPALYELVNIYKPDIVWSDGEWEASDHYWKSKEFLSWLYNYSPVKDTVITNDRWGTNTPCEHGGYHTCHDKFNPGVLQKHKWENCMTIDKQSWGYRKDALNTDYMAIEELISQLASTVSCGGNLLMNVGPTKEGTIAPIYMLRLNQMGSWMNVNGEAIYATVPWKYQKDIASSNVWYTSSADGKTVYAIVLTWPETRVLFLGAPQASKLTTVSVLGLNSSYPITWKSTSPGITIQIPFLSPPEIHRWAWVIRLTHLK